MTVAKITELSAASTVSFEDAIRVAVARASKTLKNITGAWVQDQKVDIKDGEIERYRVTLKLSFILED